MAFVDGGHTQAIVLRHRLDGARQDGGGIEQRHLAQQRVHEGVVGVVVVDRAAQDAARLAIRILLDPAVGNAVRCLPRDERIVLTGDGSPADEDVPVPTHSSVNSSLAW